MLHAVFRMFFLLLACCAVLVVSAAFGGHLLKGPVISFLANPQGNREIYLADWRTRVIYNFTRTPYDEWSFSWSQDGRYLLHNSITTVNGDDILFLSGANGRLQHVIEDLGPTLRSFNLILSPDAQFAAFVSSFPRNVADIFLVNLWSGETHNLSNSPEISELTPVWSPDSRQLAYTARALSNNADLFVHEFARGDVQQLTDTAQDERLPLWSPDGARIAFFRVADDDTTTLWTIDTQHNASQQIESEIEPLANPVSWSPDSKQLAFTLSTRQIAVYDWQHDRLQILSDGSRRDLDPAWSPDGRWLAFVSQRGIDLFSIADGTRRAWIADFKVKSPLLWQP